MKRLNPVVWLLLLWAVLIYAQAHAAGYQNEPPRSSIGYRNDLIRLARFEWGLIAPVALFAGQIEQESAWRPSVCSVFACGLAQFTPPTAHDLAPRLNGEDVFNPVWSMRALVMYDHDLYTRLTAVTECDRWAFVLSSYNGGLGNVRKDILLCRNTDSCDAATWWNNVELHSARSTSAFRENRSYPYSILRNRQLTYTSWGAKISCP